MEKKCLRKVTKIEDKKYLLYKKNLINNSIRYEIYLN